MKKTLFVLAIFCLSGCSSKEDRIRQLFDKAEKATEPGKKIELYESILQEDSSYANAYWRLAEIYSKPPTKDGKKALECWNHVIEVIPGWAEAFHNRGLSFFYDKNYPSSVLDFSQAINLHPSDFKHTLNRGISYYYSNEYEKAKNDFLRAYDLSQSKETSALFSLALASLALNQPEEAIQALSHCIEQGYHQEDCYLNRAIILFKKKDYVSSKSDFKQVLKLNPTSDNLSYYLGMIEIELNDYSSALEDLTKALNQRKDDVLCLFERARAYTLLGKSKEAVLDYSKIIEVDPANSRAFFMRGKTLMPLADLKGAEEDFKKYLEISKWSAPDLSYDKAFTLGESETGKLPGLTPYEKFTLETGEMKPAGFYPLNIHFAEEILKKLKAESGAGGTSDDNQGDLFHKRDLNDDFIGSPKSEPTKESPLSGFFGIKATLIVLLLSGVVAGVISYRKRKPEVNPKELLEKALSATDSEEKIRWFTEAIEADPFLREAYYKRALVYQSLKDTENTLKDLDKLIKLDPINGEIFRLRGNIKKAKGDVEGSREDFKKANELKDSVYYVGRGIAQIKEGEYEKALGEFDEALKRNPEQHLAFSSRGVAKVHLGDIDSAIEDYTKAICLSPNYINAYKNRATAFEKKGDMEAAEADKAKATELENEKKSEE